MKRWNRRRWKKAAGETRGQEIAEAAVVLPLVFMLLLGIYWFGRAYNIYATITHAAREGARVAVVSNCATCGNTAPSTVAIANQVIQTLQASKIDPNQVSVYTPTPAPVSCTIGVPPCSVQNNITFCSNVQLNPGSTGPQVCGVSVSFQYPYQFFLPFTSLNMQKIWLKADVQLQGED
ncbi:MAG TPA: TadE/TadG family type IV pilus assembly protein [Terriglobales bacterium]|nr:TadE/TadG family type IV pilus assembly protein [Terriglobales bacterium]